MISLIPFFGVVRISGDDSAQFLHNQLSNDIASLAIPEACYATYNTAQGRVIANMLILRTAENDFYLICAADLIEKIIKRFRMFVLRSKVVFEDVSTQMMVVAEDIDQQDIAMPHPIPLSLAVEQLQANYDITLPHGGKIALIPTNDVATVDEMGLNLWQSYEITHGYPWLSVATSEIFVAQMLNQHLLGGVHFRKGCYPGQEIIARSQYRGKVKRGLASFRTTKPVVVGEDIVDQQAEDSGVVLNFAQDKDGFIVLAVIKHGAANEPLQTASAIPLVLQQIFFEQDEE